MAFLSSDDKDIAQPMELSLFASPTNQVAVEKVYFTEARPISSIGVVREQNTLILKEVNCT